MRVSLIQIAASPFWLIENPGVTDFQEPFTLDTSSLLPDELLAIIGLS